MPKFTKSLEKVFSSVMQNLPESQLCQTTTIISSSTMFFIWESFHEIFFLSEFLHKNE